MEAGHDERLRTDHFSFELPEELIAREPLPERDGARMLVLPRAEGPPSHGWVSALAAELRAGDLLVFNNTRVLPARLRARRASGGRVEFLLHAPAGDTSEGAPWWSFAKPAKRLRPGERLAAEVDPAVEFELLERSEKTGLWKLRLLSSRAPVPAGQLGALLDVVGEIPLPPYIDRAPVAEDRERYQTVYAERPGAVAAPTAGLHFTDRIFEELLERGVEQAFVTLHVGAGTFLPVTADHIDEHTMHAEVFELGEDVARAVARCRERGGRVIAVGTTSARVLESCALESDPNAGTPGQRASVAPGSGSTDIFLHPKSPPRVIDGLFTNFHLPKSTLLMLVSSIAGTERVLAAYREAVEQRYRFYSYGDAMLIL